MRVLSTILLLSFIAIIAAKRRQSVPAPTVFVDTDVPIVDPEALVNAVTPSSKNATELDELLLNGDFETLFNKYAKKCKCSGQTCLCCFAVPIVGFRSCISSTQVVSERNLQMKVVVENITAINESYLLGPYTQKCGILPSKLLNLNACLISGTKQEGDDLKYCISFGLQAAPGAMSGIKISCITLTDDGISFNGKTNVRGSDVFTSWANPGFHKAVPRILSKSKSGKNKKNRS